MKQSELAEIYRKYLGPKCSRTTFYANIRKGMTAYDAIKPVPHTARYKPGKVKTRKFQAELEWYLQQEGDKVSRSRFYQRLYQGWSKENAIKTGRIIPQRKKMFLKKKPPYQRPIASIQKSANIEEDIKIKYNEDEAKIFCNEYEKMIKELEEQYYEAEGDEAKEIDRRLEKLVKEYQTFRLYNK